MNARAATAEAHQGESAAPGDAAAFAAFFEQGWAIGATDPERFFAHICSRMETDAALTQSLAATTYGHAGLRELFAPLFEAVPDLRGDVVRWGATQDGVMVELHLHGTLGGRPIAWTVVDRIVLRDGRIAARHAYFDSVPVALRLLRTPRASAPLLRALLRR